MQAHEEGGAEPCELAIYKSVSHIHRSKPVVESETTDLPQMSTLAGPLDGVLQNPITSQAGAEIVHHLWRDGGRVSLRGLHFVWDAYFGYYTRECTAALTEEGTHMCARTHAGLVQIAHLLEDANDEEEIRKKNSAKHS
jgi:hypothetical protein